MLVFQDYKKCVLNKETQMRQMNVIRSHKHDVYAERQSKVALSHDDDKRIILKDGVHTLARGHYFSKVRVSMTKGRKKLTKI